jgi:predicted RNase H-like HicB family nuclease
MRYTARYARDVSGWTVTIPGNPGGMNCVSQGRSLAQARTRIREALAVCLDDPKAASAAEIEERIEIAPAVRTRLRRVAAKRARAEKLRAEASEETRTAARVLIDQGLSVRDAAELLGISFQRVQQLLEQAETAGKATSRRR